MISTESLCVYIAYRIWGFVVPELAYLGKFLVEIVNILPVWQHACRETTKEKKKNILYYRVRRF